MENKWEDASQAKRGNEMVVYFAPSIEDIHVGYECEISLGDQEGNLVPNKITIDDEWLFRIARWNKDKIIVPLQVPYLTNEQILAEGWVEDPEKGLIKGDWILFSVNFSWDGHPPQRKIALSYNGKQMFGGECKDINTFRKICKLLGI